MADKYYAPRADVRLSRDDREWLVRFARHEDTSVQAVVDHALWFFCYWQGKGKKAFKEALEIIDLLCCAYQEQVRRRRYFEREYRVQLRRLHDMRRAYEERLWQERSIRRVHESQLRQERSMRCACEEQLQRQRSYSVEEERATAQPHRDAPYGPTVARLLALAVCSDSDGEATAAFEKARALHRLAA